MAYRNKSYSDKLLIGINRADLFRQGSCRNSDDSSRDELIFRGSYSDNAIPAKSHGVVIFYRFSREIRRNRALKILFMDQNDTGSKRVKKLKKSELIFISF